MWFVICDNGADYVFTLPERFDTEREAEVAGENWLLQFRSDNDITDEDDPAGFDVKYSCCEAAECPTSSTAP